jgi:hypothetical protein
MNTTISQISYPGRQAFFEKLALSLSPQPAIKIGSAPLFSGGCRPGSRNMRKAVPTEMLSTAQRSMKASRGSQRDQRQEARALSSEDHSTRAREGGGTHQRRLQRSVALASSSRNALSLSSEWTM